jgi:RNA polymerase sigma factor (sigma-70 family)
MRSALHLTDETFEALLLWLDPDRETAARNYETIRAGLIRIFASQGCGDAEDLADQAINRVAARVPEIRDSYVGEPASYFRGVARKIVLECRRRKEVATDLIEVATDLITESPDTRADPGDEYECLLRCLKFLSVDKRELILDYHLYEGREKITNHRIMAGELGLSESALRLKAHRIRAALEKCVRECAENVRGKRKPL